MKTYGQSIRNLTKRVDELEQIIDALGEYLDVDIDIGVEIKKRPEVGFVLKKET